jgi:hypothetical protein
MIGQASFVAVTRPARSSSGLRNAWTIGSSGEGCEPERAASRDAYRASGREITCLESPKQLLGVVRRARPDHRVDERNPDGASEIAH